MDVLSEDRALLDAYRRGQPAALERVYRSYVDQVARLLRHGFCFSSGMRKLRFEGYRSPDDLQDALQEVFLLALGEGARSRYDGLQPFGAYVTAVTRNVVLGRFRRDARRLRAFRDLGYDETVSAEHVADDVHIPLSAGFLAPDVSLEQKQVQNAVRAFVATLDAEQRNIVRLHYLESTSQEATAQALDINRNRVRKVIRGMKKRLLAHLRRIETMPPVPSTTGTEEVGT